MPDFSNFSARYFIDPPAFRGAVAIVLATKGQPVLALRDRRGRAIRIDRIGVGQSWGDVSSDADADHDMDRDGRCILVFAALADARACWFGLQGCGVQT